MLIWREVNGLRASMPRSIVRTGAISALTTQVRDSQPEHCPGDPRGVEMIALAGVTAATPNSREVVIGVDPGARREAGL